MARITVSPSAGKGQKLARRTAGDLSLTSTSWTAVESSLDLTLSGVAVGDVLEASVNGFLSASATVSIYLDAVTVVSSVVTNYFSSRTGTPAGSGTPGWQANPFTGNVGDTVSGSAFYAVQAGDISNGSVTVRLAYRATVATGRTLTANTSSPLQFAVANLGQPQA